MHEATDHHEGSVTNWLKSLRSSDSDAIRQLWDRYFCRVVALARRDFGKAPKRVVDEEDVAVSVLDTLIRGAAEGRFTDLNDRRTLCCLLVAITHQKVVDARRAEGRLKRGGGKVRGDSVMGKASSGQGLAGWDRFAAESPTPEFLVALEEQFAQLYASLRDDGLRSVVSALMEGHTVREIAKRMGVSKRTVERKVALIRDKWARILAGG